MEEAREKDRYRNEQMMKSGREREREREREMKKERSEKERN